jgi:alpha-glucosidase
VAEVGGDEADAEMKAFTEGETHLNSAYGFDFLYADALTPQLVCRALSQWPDAPGVGWPSWAFENHDAPRAASRWWGEADRTAASRMKIALLAALRGNIIVYQGEELGLDQVEIPFERLHDPEAIANWPLTLSRDGARTPMPWSAEAGDHGFGSADPWLPVGDANARRAVDLQEADAGSLLAHTRAMLALRRAHPALRHGAVEACRGQGDLLVLDRAGDGECIRLIANLGKETIVLDQEVKRGAVLASVNDAGADRLPPFGALLVRL